MMFLNPGWKLPDIPRRNPDYLGETMGFAVLAGAILLGYKWYKDGTWSAFINGVHGNAGAGRTIQSAGIAYTDNGTNYAGVYGPAYNSQVGFVPGG